MVKEIVKDVDELKIPCSKITDADFVLVQQIIVDLTDTAEAYKDRCIGLAANQIGYNKRVILILAKDQWIPLINPVLMPNRKKGKHSSEEGCLSLDGIRTVERFNSVNIVFKDTDNKIHKLNNVFGLIGEIIQHECDHLDGILI
jgi:peptide deformylase